VIQVLNGKMKPQVDELQRKADEWANKVKEGWMDRRLAWTCLRSMIWPSLSYPLRVCSISKNQGDAIIVQLYQALLPELGLQRKFPKIWRYAPCRFQALALPHPYFVQGQEQICLFQQLGLSNEISGGLLCISLDQAQFELGRNVPLLQDDYKTWGFLLTQNLWIGSMWEFCDEYKITLEASRSQAPEIQRDNDIFIMQLFEAHFNFTGIVQERQQQWRALNRCRLSLQVLFLSDITSGDGTCIERDYFHYHGTATRPLSSQWEWPLQQPARDDWDLWHAAMREITATPTGKLDQRFHLGPWIREPHQHRPWRYDTNEGFLYEHKKEHQVWKRYRPELRQPTRHQYFVPDTILAEKHLPLNLQMATALPTATSQ
jgi:hypothetical protein